MATEDFFWNLSPLPSPRWSPLRLTPSPPRHILPSSGSMVMQYQGCNQSMDNPPQNQEHDDILDPAPYLAGDSALLQQQLRKNWSEASSDWRPRGGGIMTMNNQGFEESNMGFEESMEMTTCFYFPPSPTNFPLYRQMPGLDSPINDNSFLNAGAWAPPPMQFQRMQIFAKVYKSGSFGRSIDVARYSGYEELKQDLARMFGIEGQLEDRHRVGCTLVCVDHENDVLLVGDDPWEAFIHCVWYIKILSPQEVQELCLNIGSFTTEVDAETPTLVEPEGIPQLNSDTLPSDQALAAPVEKITSVVVKEILHPPFSLTAQQERLDEDFGNVEAEAVGIESGGTGQSEMEDGQRNSRYLGKRKRKEMTPRGERRNKEIGGVRIAISLEEILQAKEMPLKDAAKHLKVSKSTLKRACREHDIPRWPPRGEQKPISQSCPIESPAVVDKEPIPQLNYDHTLLPSNQVSAIIGTKSVIVKARFGTATMKFQLSWPWGMVELKEQVKKRLGHEAENYYINYKDEDNEYIIIACDEDLHDHISRSSLLGTNLIEVFLQPK